MFNFDSIKDSLLKFLHVDSLVENISGYVEARVELLKIEIKEDVSKAIAKGLILMCLMLFFFLFLLFVSFGLAMFLNTEFDSPTTGYWIVAGIYFVAFLLFLLLRKSFSRSFEKYLMLVIKRKEI